MKFQKIVCVDNTKLQPWALKELQQYSEEQIAVYDDYPDSKEEILQRIGAADAVLVSWHTQLDEQIIEKCENLRYIGMACSLYDDASANVAVNYARSKGIEVKGIKDYGDPGVAEFIISQLIQLLHGFGEQQWREKPQELTGKKIGIIGMGTTGQLLASCLLPFGAELYYFSRSRKPQWEEKGVKYLPLQELLMTAEIVSFHLPKNTNVLKAAEFAIFGTGKILVNTSLGLPFEEAAFEQWLKKEGNFGIFDADGKKELSQTTEALPNMITSQKSAGWSAATHKRLSQKVLENLKHFLNR
ncbi:MAG: NAD(P)-dependent oxidoreductase [Salinimicrobium sp.]